MKNVKRESFAARLACSCLLFSVVAVLITIPGCSTSSGSGSKGNPPTLQSITVTAAASSVSVGGTDQLTATGNYSDSSTQNLTSTATWTSASTGIATVSASGLASGVAAGSSNITAASGGVTSSPYSLTVNAPTLTSIAVTAAASSVVVGGTDQLTATGTYSDKSTQNITSSVTWASATKSVATIATSGLASAVAPGSTNVTASSGTVTSPPLTLTVNSQGGNSSGSTAILVIPAPARAADGTRFRYVSHTKAGGHATPTSVDGAYQPQGTTPNATTGQYSVQVINLDTGTSTSALITSIPMPATDSSGAVYMPNATGGSQSELKVIVISWTSPDVQVIDANTNTIVKTYTSPVPPTTTVTFSGGTCSICGVFVNPTASSNEVLLNTALGYYSMDIATGTFTALDGGTAYPAENFAFNQVTQTILSPNYGTVSTSSTSTPVPVGIQLLDLANNTISTNDSVANLSTNPLSTPDSGAVDSSTNIGMVVDENGGAQWLFNLGDVTVSSGNWTSPYSVYTIPLQGFEMTYCAVDSVSHTLFTSQEFGGIYTAIELLPSSAPTSGNPPANPTGYVWDTMPNTPDMNSWANGYDPHAVSVFTSVYDGKLYGFLVNDTQTWIAKIDLAGALKATPVSNPTYPGQIDLTSYTTYLPTTQ